MPVSNVCPHCDTLVPREARAHVHADAEGDLSRAARSRSVPAALAGGRPRIADGQAGVGAVRAGPQLRQQALERRPLPAAEPGGLHARQPCELDELPIEDRWILSRLATTTAAVTEQLEGYRFSEAARTIYDFTWSEFCDWYVEMSKGRLRDAAGRPLVQRVLAGVLDAHPAAGAADHAVRGRVDLAGAGRAGLRARPAGAGAGRRKRGHRRLAEFPASLARRGDGSSAWPGCRSWCGACARCAIAT